MNCKHNYSPNEANAMLLDARGPVKEKGIQLSKLLAGINEITLLVVIVMVGVIYIVNGSLSDEIIEFFKWVAGGTSVTSVTYMIKSGIENKAKIEHFDTVQTK